MSRRTAGFRILKRTAKERCKIKNNKEDLTYPYNKSLVLYCTHIADLTPTYLSNMESKKARTKQTPNRQPYAPPTTGYVFTINPSTQNNQRIPQGKSSDSKQIARSLSEEFHSALLINHETPAPAFKFSFNEQNKTEPTNRPHFTFNSDPPKALTSDQPFFKSGSKPSLNSPFRETLSTPNPTISAFSSMEQPQQPTNVHQILSQFTSIELSEMLQQSIVKEQMKFAQNLENLRREQEAVLAEKEDQIAVLKEDLEFEKGFLEMEEQRFGEAEHNLLKELDLNKLNFATLKAQMDADNEANRKRIETLESKLINNQLLEDLPINAPSSLEKQRTKAQQDVKLFNDSVRDACCPICTNTFKEYASDCGHMYCLSCITKCKNDVGRSGKCYFCNGTIGVIRKIFMN